MIKQDDPQYKVWVIAEGKAVSPVSCRLTLQQAMGFVRYEGKKRDDVLGIVHEPTGHLLQVG